MLEGITSQEFMTWEPERVQAIADELIKRPLRAENIEQWLYDWRLIGFLFQEAMARLEVATDVDTSDEAAKERLNHYRGSIAPIGRRMSQALDQKLLDHAGLLPPDFEIPLKLARQDAELYNEATFPLWDEEAALSMEYNRLYGAQLVSWQGEERTAPQMRQEQQHPDRSHREAAWRAQMARAAQDRAAIGEVWRKLLQLRSKIAASFHLSDYLQFRFRDLRRFDYTPEDSRRFHDDLEAVMVPAAKIILEKRRAQLGVEALRPWDLVVDPGGTPPLRPFQTAEELIKKASRVFYRIDPEFGAYFDKMCAAGLVDLEDRPYKGNYGGFTRVFANTGTFLCMKVTGSHRDMENLMHEMGHAFSHHENFKLRYMQQMGTPADFSETPSTAMEMLSMPYWDEFYTPEDIRRAQLEYCQSAILAWCQYPLWESFQFWAYTHLDEAMDLDRCDAKWLELSRRFYPVVDGSGIEAEQSAGWQGYGGLFYLPLHGMEYGYGQLAAVNLWQQAQQDLSGAVARYKKAAGLGSTVTVPEMFAALGTPFPFSRADLQRAADALLAQIDVLEAE